MYYEFAELQKKYRISSLCQIFEVTLRPCWEEGSPRHNVHRLPTQVIIETTGRLGVDLEPQMAVVLHLIRHTDLLPLIKDLFGKVHPSPSESLYLAMPVGSPLLFQRTRLLQEASGRFIRRVRKWLDEAGLDNRLLLVVGDGSYCNGTVIRGLPNRTTFVGRTRPDSALRLPGRERPDGTYFYGEKIPNLREVLRNPELPSTTADLWVGGESRPLKIKVLPHVYRPTSTRGVRLQAVMLIPQLYGPRGHRTYSHEAYLLTTDSRTPVEVLVQGYLDRWSIEVAHRDLKCQLGVGEAQVSNPDAIRKIHSALAAAWALLQVATLQSVGAIRTDAVFGKPPRWRVANCEWRKKKRLAEGKAAPVVRPSAIDILALFRRSYRLNWTRRQVPFRL